MKILMILDNHFPIDIRVENEATSLIKAGNEVGILSIANYKQNEVVNYKGITIYRIAVSLFTHKKMPALAGMIPWMDNFVAKKVSQILKTESYDAIHFHDLYTFGAVRLLKKKYKLKYIGDMHENYVEVIKDYKWATKFPNRLLISHNKWEKKEKEWLAEMDKVITVSKGIRERIISKGIKEENTLLVPNTIHTDLFDEFRIDEGIEKKLNPYFNLIYVGGFVSNRGLEHVIEAMKELQDFASDIRLVLVGDGEIKNDLVELVRHHNVTESVLFEGWHNQDKIKSYLQSSDIGLVPFKRTPQTDNSSSNKLFQYMYYELPIVATNCTSVEKLVNLEECGLIYESGQTSDFITIIKKLYQNRKMMETLGKNGKKAVIEKYNWNASTKKMIEMYENLKE